MLLEIDYEALKTAMEMQDPMEYGAAYFDTETGDVLFLGDWVEDQARQFDDPAAIDDEVFRLARYLLWRDGKLEKELSEAEKKETSEQANAYLARFLEAPTVPSREAYRDMVDFTATVDDDHLRELLEVALDGRGAFRRFKDVLIRYPDERQRWFDFQAQCWRERIDDWLEAEGALPTPDAEETPPTERTNIHNS